MSLISRPLKFNSRTRKLLWCSDPHIKHRPSWSPAPWEYRGFKSADEHDEWFQAEWFKTVDAETTVFLLGDVVFTDGEGEWFRRFTQWPGQILHVWGNHPSGAKAVYREAVAERVVDLAGVTEIYPLKVGNLTFMGDSLHAWIDGQSVWMQHYAPYIWPEMGNDGWALCGHSHSSCKPLNPGRSDQGFILDVGFDNAIKSNGTPFFTWEQVKQVMRGKVKVVKDHHDGSVAGQ